VTPPSGSLRVAVKSMPNAGSVDDRLTVPGSSTLVMEMVTSILSRPPDGSLASTLIEYDAVVSKSRAVPWATEICPVDESMLKPDASVPDRL
jgi:hypothetical protein